MFNVADVLQMLFDVLDAIFNWRLWVCTAVGFAVALLLHWAFPTIIEGWAMWAFPIAGLVIGMAWELLQ